MAGTVKKTVQLLDRFFSPLFQRAPQLVVLFSMIGWILGHFQFVPALDTVGPLFLAVLAGGFFALLAKGALFRQIISEELTSILYSSDHLSNRRDTNALWRNVTVAVGLPVAIADLAYKQLLKSIWDKERPYYYRNLRRTHRLRWDAVDKFKLLVESHIEAELLPAQPDKPFTKRGALTCNLPGAVGAPSTLHSRFRCSVTHQVFNAPFSQDVQDPSIYRSEIALPASPMYEVDECWEFAQNVTKDNMIMFQSPVFVNGMTVSVEYDPADMLVLLLEIGDFGFQPCKVGKLDRARLKMEAQLMMPPWAGYVLAVQRV